MPSFEVIIEPKEPKNPPKPSARRKAPKVVAKTREFRAGLVGYVAAGDWWGGGSSGAENIRPVYATFVAGEGAMRPFLANLRLGRRAIVQPYRDQLVYGGSAPTGYLELLKSAGYQALEQRVTGGPQGATLFSTLYLPTVCTLDPGLIDPTGIRFVALTPQAWIRAQQATFSADSAAVAAVAAHVQALGLVGTPRPAGGAPWTLADLLALVPQAVHTVAYLERRTTRPLVNTVAFSLQLFLAGLERGLFSLPHPVDAGTRTLRFRPGDYDPADRWHWARHTTITYQTFFADGVAALGLAAPVACHHPHTVIDPFLAQQVTRYFAAQQQPTGDPLPRAA
ncbi:MAG: hypothetical protein M3Z04_10810 [Chloroflexota bacterium]|nr:hypothetical protein [Chloroflexota bacterium]